jgi:RNA ligase (TIGR02306 family)
MQRKLASIQTVLEIQHIPSADAIELARINGWQCVVKKGEFEQGSLGVFLEIDAVPPDLEIFRFLWRPKTAEEGVKFDRPEKFRIRTMKLRGALSQGLLLSTAALGLTDVSAGDDVTELLGVTKYEPPAPPNMGGFRANFPDFIPKTDEMRIQSVPEVTDELHGLPYAIALKYDGTSSTFCIDPRDGEFHACGRNYSLAAGSNYYWRVADKYGIEAILRKSPHLAIQGEICGPGIQKNRLELKDISLFVFNIYNIEQAHYLSHHEAHKFITDSGLTPAEVVEIGDAFTHDQISLLALAEGKYPNTKNEREGIVIRSIEETYSTILAGRLSFKAISNRFLLKESD